MNLPGNVPLFYGLTSSLLGQYIQAIPSIGGKLAGRMLSMHCHGNDNAALVKCVGEAFSVRAKSLDAARPKN